MVTKHNSPLSEVASSDDFCSVGFLVLFLFGWWLWLVGLGFLLLFFVGVFGGFLLCLLFLKPAEDLLYCAAELRDDKELKSCAGEITAKVSLKLPCNWHILAYSC